MAYLPTCLRAATVHYIVASILSICRAYRDLSLMSSELCAQENRLAASRIASSTRHKSTPDSGKPVTEGSSRGHTRKGPTAVPGPIRDNYSCRLLSRQMQVVALMQYRIDRWRRSQTGKIY